MQGGRELAEAAIARYGPETMAHRWAASTLRVFRRGR
jgi:hypothetical protein